MPYIPSDARELLDPHIAGLSDALDDAPAGFVNYAVTRIVHEWLGPTPRYADYNAAIGMLECAKLELYRKRTGPYEDLAEIKNGPLPDSRP